MGGHHTPLRPTKYFSIDDIPDEMVTKYSKRDPENQIYRSRRYVNFKKKQILFSQKDGVPNYLRTPMGRFTYYSIWAAGVGSLVYNIYLFNKHSKN